MTRTSAARRLRLLPLLAAGALVLALPGCGDDTDDDTPVPGDLDGDGFSPDTGDCKEGDSRVYPGATETCNGRDDDCDAITDPGCDGDGDGYLGALSGGDDCDDTSAATHPGADELCDGADNNCDSVVDNAADRDDDGFGPCDTGGTPIDCNDLDATIYPGALELLDGTTNDCAQTATLETVLAPGAAASLIGEYGGDLAGTVVVRAGDLNGDGVDDLAIGAPSANAGSEDTGKVYLFFGGTAGRLEDVDARFPSSIDLSYADVTLGGIAQGDKAGTYLAGVGDVDGDTLDDLWIGAPGASSGAGAGYLVRGRTAWPSTYVSLAASDAVFRGPAKDSALGPAAGGDVDGDGISDLLIGAPGEAKAVGAAYLFFGGDDLPSAGDLWSASARAIPGGAPGARTGASVSVDADVNQDGLRDLTIAAPGVGQIWVLLSEGTGWVPVLADAQITLLGPSSENVGFSLSFAGDVNDDGYQDLIIGAPGSTGSAGRVYIVLFKPSLLQANIALEDDADLIFDGADGAELGTAVASGGDLNGDGIDDLTVGGPGLSSAYLLHGWTQVPPTNGLVADTADAAFAGPEATSAGAALSLDADLDDDGSADWIIGAPFENTGGAQAGMTYLLLGYGP